MKYRIVLCGGNGAGKSTLGKELAKRLNIRFMDIEHYYFPSSNADYAYGCSRTQEETGCFLGLTDENRTLLARLDLKRAMTLPASHLFLSYARTSPDGAALRPLSLLTLLRERILPHVKPSPVPASELPMSSAQALAQLSLQLRSGMLSPIWQERLHALLRSPATAPEAMPPNTVISTLIKVEVAPTAAMAELPAYRPRIMESAALKLFCNSDSSAVGSA